MNFQNIFLIVASYVIWLVTVTVAQFEYSGLFNEYLSSEFASQRDARQDRGPVVFPQSPIGSETSGVRVGASGFGFVPPGSRRRGVGGSLRSGPYVFNEELPYF